MMQAPHDRNVSSLTLLCLRQTGGVDARNHLYEACQILPISRLLLRHLS